MREAMDEQRMESGVAGDDFPGRARRRVALEYAGYVFSDSRKHVISKDATTIIGNPSESVNYFLPISSHRVSMPRRMLTSTFSSRALANSRRSRSMSFRG